MEGETIMTARQLRAQISALRTTEAVYIDMGVFDGAESARRARRAARLALRTLTGGRRRSI